MLRPAFTLGSPRHAHSERWHHRLTVIKLKTRSSCLTSLLSAVTRHMLATLRLNQTPTHRSHGLPHLACGDVGSPTVRRCGEVKWSTRVSHLRRTLALFRSVVIDAD